MTQPDLGPAQSLRQLRLIIVSTIGVLTAILLVLPTIGPSLSARAETVWLAIPALLGLALVFLIPGIGNTVRPVPAGTSADDAQRIAAGVVRTVLFLRMAMAESVGLVALVLAFVAESGLVYVVGYLFSVVLLALLVYPRERVIAPIRDTLESNGVTSGL
jgi:F0F1-type ATP synthase membrane subunit c/vacuolar-type H+-ATPase subunit K